MMKKLRSNNFLIIDLIPGNYLLRKELSLELKNIAQNDSNLRILEIGSGEGDLTKSILENCESIKIDCLDISIEMINSSKKFLLKILDRINFINEDVYSYLQRIDFTYGVIASAWTIHNFTRKDKKKVFERIYTALSKEGKFLLVDKIYPDNQKERRKMFELQMHRFGYLPMQIRKELIVHENQDLLDDYRMDESDIIETLKGIGFKKIKILDRVDRDVLLIAEK